MTPPVAEALQVAPSVITAVPGAVAPPPGVPPAVTRAVEPTARGIGVKWADGRSLDIDQLAVIGRDPVASDSDGPHVAIPVTGDGLVSKTHLAIGRAADGSLWVEDRHSTNGVTVNDNELPPGGRVPLELGDVIRFGGQVLHVPLSAR